MPECLPFFLSNATATSLHNTRGGGTEVSKEKCFSNNGHGAMLEREARGGIQHHAMACPASCLPPRLPVQGAFLITATPRQLPRVRVRAGMPGVVLHHAACVCPRTRRKASRGRRKARARHMPAEKGQAGGVVVVKVMSSGMEHQALGRMPASSL